MTDRDGMYLTVSPAGTVTFRYDDRVNGRRETLTMGRCGRAREKPREMQRESIRLMHQQLETVASSPTIRLALARILLTLVRRGELIDATWNEIDVENTLWPIWEKVCVGPG